MRFAILPLSLILCSAVFAENSTVIKKGDEFNLRDSEKIEYRGKIYMAKVHKNRFGSIDVKGETYWYFKREVWPVAAKTRRGETPLPKETQDRLRQEQYIGVNIKALPNRAESQAFDRRYEVVGTFKKPGKTVAYRLGSPTGDRRKTRTEPPLVIHLLEVPEE